MNNFWQQLPKPFFALAPMEAVTDIVFRQVVAKAGRPDIFFTEFVNTASFCSPNGQHSTASRLAFEKHEQPLVAQIWGTEPEHFAKMTTALARRGYAGVDINMGCPDKAVVKIGAGSALIRTPERAKQIIQATKNHGLPVSVKTRLGDSSLDDWTKWLTLLLEQDLANLTIHLRTRKEMSKVPAHYELIPAILKLRDQIAPQTLLTINGDVTDRQHGLTLYQQYGCDGLMIGRGVFNNPFAFEETPTNHNLTDRLDLLHYQLDLHDYYDDGTRKFDPLKHFFKIYISDFPGSRQVRQQLMGATNTAEVRQILCHAKIA